MPLTPEQLARIEAGVATEEDLAAQAAEDVHSDAPDVSDQVDDVADEIVDVAEELALHSIISEERHEEILECLRRLEQSSTSESPSLTAIQRELADLRSELVNMRSSMVSTATSREPNESSSQSQENQTEEPSNIEVPEVTAPKPPEKKRARFI